MKKSPHSDWRCVDLVSMMLTSYDPYLRYHTADPRRRSHCTDWRQLMNLSTSPPVSLPQGPSLHHLHLIGFLSRQMVTSRTQMMTIINYVYSRHPLCESKKKIIMLCQSRTWLKVKTKKKTNWLKLGVNPLGLQDNWLKIKIDWKVLRSQILSLR